MLKKLTAMLLAAWFCLSCTACGSTTAPDSGSADSTAAAVETGNPANIILDPSQMFTNRDYETDYSNYSTITLRDRASTADNNSVTITEDVITITKEGTYLLTGTLTDGQVVVDVDDTQKVQLVLDNVSISNCTSAALYIPQADKVFLTTAADSKNTLVSTGDFSDSEEGSNVDGAIFSKADLTLNGKGSLSVTCSTAHGIVSKDDLAITSGTYTISSAKQALSGKDSVRIADGTITIESDSDGIHSENTEDTEKGFVFVSGGTLNITSSNDALDASNYIAVTGGTCNITTGGGSENITQVQNGEFTGQGFGSFQHQPGGRMAESPNDSTAAPDMKKPTDGKNMPENGNAASQSDAVIAPDASGSTDTSSDTETETTTASDSYKGFKANEAIAITGGTFTIDSADDALHTNGYLSISGGTFHIASGDDGIHADSSLDISDGDITISTSYEGMEANAITVSGGTISLTASDDGLNAAGGNDGSSLDGRWGQNSFDSSSDTGITISGGNLAVQADGDGLDSNGSLLVSGGTVYVSASINGGNGALDYTSSGTITGGTVITAGISGMEQNFDSNSTQGCIHYDVSSTQSAGTEIKLTDSNGNILASYTPKIDFQCITISSPDITEDGTYTLTAGSESAEIQMNGYIYGSTGGIGRRTASPDAAGKTDGRKNSAVN